MTFFFPRSKVFSLFISFLILFAINAVAFGADSVKATNQVQDRTFVRTLGLRTPPHVKTNKPRRQLLDLSSVIGVSGTWDMVTNSGFSNQTCGAVQSDDTLHLTETDAGIIGGDIDGIASVTGTQSGKSVIVTFSVPLTDTDSQPQTDVWTWDGDNTITGSTLWYCLDGNNNIIEQHAMAFVATRESTDSDVISSSDKGSKCDNSNTSVINGDQSGQCLGECADQNPGLPNYWVNTSALNLYVQDTDFKSEGIGPGVSTTRSWNADPAVAGMFGNGWSSKYETSIVATCSGATVTKGTGQTQAFTGNLCVSAPLTSPIVTTPPSGVFDQLTLMPGNYWVWLEKSTKYSYRFDSVTYNSSVVGSYRLTSITDKNGNAVTLAYNPNGTLSSLTDAASRITTFGYGSNGLCSSITTTDGKRTAYSYDGNGNLLQTVDILGTAINYTYNSSNYMATMTVGAKTSTFAYSTTGGWTHIATVTDANGNTRTFSATSATQTSMTDARGGVTQYQNQSGLTTGVTDPLGNVTTTAYANGLPTTVTDAKKQTRNMAYDIRGNLLTSTDPLVNTTSYTYDTNSNLLTVTNALNQTWTFTYDGDSDLIKLASPLGHVTAYAYNSKGELTSTTDANNNVTAFTYDAFGNIQKITDPLGNSTPYGYDAYGLNRTSVTDANGNVSQLAYDNNRRLTKVTHADGTIKTFTYDACSMTAITDENGHETTLTRDNLLNITGITDPLGNYTAKTYDANRNMLTLVDALTHTYKNTYDLGNRLIAAAKPSGNTVFFGYDRNPCSAQAPGFRHGDSAVK